MDLAAKRESRSCMLPIIDAGSEHAPIALKKQRITECLAEADPNCDDGAAMSAFGSDVRGWTSVKRALPEGVRVISFKRR